MNFPKNAQDQARLLAESTPEIEAKLNSIHSQDIYGIYEVKEHIEFCFRCITKVLKIEKQVTLILADIYLFSNKDISQILNRPVTTIRHYLEDARKEMKDIFEESCALLHKKGVCDQCSELNGYFNGRQKVAEEKIIWEELKNKNDKDELYELRRIITKDINPSYSKGRALHDYFGWIVFSALKKKNKK